MTSGTSSESLPNEFLDLGENTAPWVEVTSKRKEKCDKSISYSDVVRKNPFDLKIPTITKGRVEPVVESSHILLLEGEQKSEKLDQNIFGQKKEQIKKLVDVKSQKIRINDIAPTKTGGILISCPSKADLEKTKAILEQNKTNLKLTPKYPTKKLPKISITNIDSAIPDNQIKNIILEQNDFIREKLENADESFNLVFAKNDRDFTKKAIFVCSPTIRSLIMKQGCLYIDCAKCICTDNLFIHQCLHCTGFGHTEKFCHRKSSCKVTCTYCSYNHRVTECPHKNNVNRQCCANCQNSSNLDVRNNARSHSSTSRDCPVFIQELTKLTLKTNYGCDFVQI